MTPDYCDVVISATIESALDTKLTFDNATQTFSLPQFSDSLDLSGSTSTDYTVTVSYETFSKYQVAAQQSGSKDLVYTIKNPCIDTDYVVITPPTDAINQKYIVFDDPANFTVSDFTLTTTPISDHGLCGDIAVTYTFDGVALPANGDPLSFVTDTGPTDYFSIDSEDTNLIGEVKPYSLKAVLADWPKATYPGVTESSVTKTISFNDPCDDPFTFSANDQTDPANYLYDGTLEFALTQFTITPSICEVEYTCDSIARSDGLTNTYLPCSALTFDGVIDESTDANNDVTDGKLTFSATADDYTNNVYPPGEYVVTIKGTTTDSGDEVTSTMTITIVDVCNPPQSITAPGLADQDYILTTSPDNYAPSDFTIDPSYCPFNTASTITDLSPNTLPSPTSSAADDEWALFYD